MTTIEKARQLDEMDGLQKYADEFYKKKNRYTWTAIRSDCCQSGQNSRCIHCLTRGKIMALTAGQMASTRGFISRKSCQRCALL